ncbi:two-component system sensor histidine kinase YesM [Paenibacillus castaneae]|uniref:sensor histidine kinase n=1 Tax=Paenibacillus castaneae TaxID=474957 RepID=UPI000C9AF876|nr:histidine kinase [Paenibacillus castaneae]NIK77016.1 two-component system sensor histidine kinase YesM [Paenibacillus castaneae]
MLKIPVNSLRHSLFLRLVLMYLIVIFPIILLCVYLYNWSYNNASSDISRNTLAQLSSYLEDMNREVEWLEVQQFDMLQEGELNKIAVTWNMMDSVEKKESMDYLLHRLTSIKNSSAYMKDIYVHIRSIGKTLSFGNGVHDFEQDRYDQIRSALDRSTASRLIEQNGSLHLSASKFGGKKGEEPLFIVQIELDTVKLKESLNQLSVYPESGSFLIAEGAGFTLLSNDQSSDIMNDYLKASNRSDERSLLLKADGRTYHVDKAESAQLGLTIVTYLPEETVKRPLNKFNLWAWLFTITSILAIVVYFFSTYRLVHRPLLLLVQNFRRMEGGALDIQIEHGSKDEFGYLYDRFNKMLNKLQTLIDQDFKQKLMMQKAELKQLQSQINPHFLYNSFFILNSLAKTGDTDRIELFTNMLGEYFRFITRNGEENVWLSEEIKHARMYTEIQKLRFSRRISVQFDDLPKEMERIRVPRLIIQPIIENAYEHSLEKMQEEGFLRVSFEHSASESLIVVEDNGNRMDASSIESLNDRLANNNEAHEMTGMINIHRRIMLTYGEGSGLFLSRSEIGGLQVAIRIHFKEAEGDVPTANRR